MGMKERMGAEKALVPVRKSGVPAREPLYDWGPFALMRRKLQSYDLLLAREWKSSQMCIIDMAITRAMPATEHHEGPSALR